MTSTQRIYRGRFAPSPTGPLHFGSLFAALASYLQARANNGQWLLRIDDIDTLRNVAGATNNIISTLSRFGFEWDEDIYFQSQNLLAYQAALAHLDQNNNTYRCSCTRKQLIAHRQQHPQEITCPGFCRHQSISEQTPHAIRTKTNSQILGFDDHLQGTISQNLAQQQGDFIIRRKDQIIAYQLAVVVDDQQQNISEVVRGIDLLDSTIKQIHLQQQLDYPALDYIHIPVITGHDGDKLSKQTFAQAINTANPGKILVQQLELLGQQPPVEISHAPIKEILDWGIQHWNPQPLKKKRAIIKEID